MSVIQNKKKYFKMLWHSDEHTLHAHTPTEHILKNIHKVRDKVGVLDIDMEVWGGDLCDDNTHTSDKDYLHLQNWMKQYLQNCHARKVLVRALAGTRSHDWELPKMFELLKPADSPYIKYVDTLSIEYIEQFDIHVLYVPDNFGNKPKSEIYEESLKLLAENNLSQVDFIFLHGAFDYQLPPIANKGDNLYDSKAWSKLASKIILSGHVHIPSTKYNIYCSGSFDRLRHGEMHPKGAYEVLFNKDECIPTFIENKHAMIYDTITITPETTPKELVKQLDKYFIKHTNKEINLRISEGKAEVVNPIIAEYKQVHLKCKFTIDNADIRKIHCGAELYEPANINTVVYTKDNVKESYLRYLGDDIPEYIDKKYLEELLDEKIK